MELCDFYEAYDKASESALLPPGVYTLHDLRAFGRKKGWCPYFLARHMLSFCNVLVYNYQYLLDPKVRENGTNISNAGGGGGYENLDTGPSCLAPV